MALTLNLAWKPAQPVDRPLEPINDGSKPKVSEDGADETSSTGSRYLDAGGKAVKPEETQEMKDDPVWDSIKQEGTRLDMDGYEHAMDEDTEKLVTEMKTNLIAEEKLASRYARHPLKKTHANRGIVRKLPPSLAMLLGTRSQEITTARIRETGMSISLQINLARTKTGVQTSEDMETTEISVGTATIATVTSKEGTEGKKLFTL